MQLLVTTPLHIFQVDIIEHRAKLIRSGDGYYYGVTCNSDQIVLTHSGGYLRYFSDEGSEAKTIKILDQPHQIEWIEGKVVVTNTGKNRLTIFDSEGTYCNDVLLNEILWDDKDGDRKGNHFNSIHKVNEKLYVIAHNYDRESELYVLSWPEFQVLQIIPCKVNGAHNFWKCEWGNLICDSENASLYNITQAKPIWKTNRPEEITRGLAATDEYIFVGSSKNCSRSERPWTSGCVWIVDRKTLRTLDKIVLPGSGEIRDIRVIEATDECHNGHVLTYKHIKKIYKPSPIINYAYRLRYRFPNLRRNIPLISIPVRALQLLGRFDVRTKQHS